MGTESYIGIALGAIGAAICAYYIGAIRGWSKGFGEAEKIYSDSAEDRVGLYREAYMKVLADYCALLKNQRPV